MPVAVQSAHRRLNVIIMAPFVKYRRNRATSRGGGGGRGGREGGETCAARFRGDFDAAIRLLIHRVGSAVESKMIVKWFRRTKFED